MPSMTPNQITWLVENREAAASALTALASEPVPHSERQRLRRLLDVLGPAARADADPHEVASLASRLSSRDFSWLSASPVPDAARVDVDSERSRATTSKILLSVTEAMRQPRYRILNFGLVYPLILLGFTWIVLIGLSLIVVPPFRAIFDEFGLTLPLPTRLLVGLSEILASGGWLWISLIVAAAIAAWLLFRIRDRLANLSFGYGLRQRGGTSELLAMSRFCRGLAEAIAANAPVAEAIRWAGSSCGHVYFERASSQLADEAQGDWSAGLIPSARLFPANLLQALAVGRDSSQGINIPLLLTLADIYEERAAERGESGATLLGIFAVVGVLCSVGFAALSLFMPLIQLVTGLS